MVSKNFSIYQNKKFEVKSPMLGKRKPNSVIGLIIIKVNIEHSERVIGKFLRNYLTFTIVLMAIAALKIGILLFFVIFEQRRTHAQLKERKTF